MKKGFSLLVLFIISTQNLVKAQHPYRDEAFYKDLQKYFKSFLVNPFIGTGGHGHTYPGATLPFGMVQCSPDTRIDGSWDGCSGYHYSDSIIYGFSHTHLSGTGCSDYGDIMLMPSLIKSTDRKDYSSSFTHKDEGAYPGYYQVHLYKPNVDVKLTASNRCALHSYTFNRNGKVYIILDLNHRDQLLESSIHINKDGSITGIRRSKAWAENQILYYAIQFSEPYKVKVIKDQNNNDSKALFTFKVNEHTTIVTKVSLSSVDESGALNNIKQEIPVWDADKYRQKADSVWDKALDKIKAYGCTKEDSTIFYTALYHTMIQPNIFNDVDGRYRGRDNQIHTVENGHNYYTVFSIWDTYRAAHPLYTLIEPERTLDFVKTFLAQYEQVGKLPVWEFWSNETNCMIGYHAVSILLDAAVKGYKFDYDKAYLAMVAAAAQHREGIDKFHNNGYLSTEDEPSSVSKTLEYCYDDWCIGQMALLMNKKIDYNFYNNFSLGWVNIYNRKSGFMQPRFNGGWLKPFDPYEVNGNYTEANAFQYSFYTPQSMDQFIELSGGKQPLFKNLLNAFTTEPKTTGNQQPDISGMIGQYAHGNEPSHHMAYLFNYTDSVTCTQKYTQQIMHTLYKNAPDGLCGNEDCGQMSAWYVLSAMGLYPVCPGDGQYTLSLPLFDSLQVRIAGVDSLNKSNAGMAIHILHIIKGKEYSSFNGKILHTPFIEHNRIAKGGILILGPLYDFKTDTTLKPREVLLPSLPPVINSTKQVFRDSLVLTIEKQSPDQTILWTFGDNLPKRHSRIYNGPILINKNARLNTMAIDKRGFPSPITTAYFYKIQHDWTVQLFTTYNKLYTAGGVDGLIDGLRGDTLWRKGRWQGYQYSDFVCVLDLKKIQSISKAGAGFLQDTRAWILYPKDLEVYTSEDGVTYTEAHIFNNTIPDKDMQVQIKDFEVSFAPVNARYVKYVAKNYGKLPDWHPGAGDGAFIFVDEVWVK